jgi:hypothetical protein
MYGKVNQTLVSNTENLAQVTALSQGIDIPAKLLSILFRKPNSLLKKPYLQTRREIKDGIAYGTIRRDL